MRVAIMAATAAATASQMRGDADNVFGTTIAISTPLAMYFRNASMRGVIATVDMIPTPASRVASVTSASSNTVTTAVESLTMAPRSDRAAGERTRDDVPACRQHLRA